MGTRKGRLKGSPKVAGSGRKAGVPNKLPVVRVVNETVADAFRRLNFDPIAELVKLMPELSPDVRAKTIVAMMPYIAAPIKALETPAQPAFQVFANIDRASLLQAVNSPTFEGNNVPTLGR